MTSAVAVCIGLMFVVSVRVHPAPGAASQRRHHRAVPQTAGPEIQLREDDLPQVRAHSSLVMRSSSDVGPVLMMMMLSSQVLRPSAPTCRQLPQEEVRPHQQPASQEEAEVDWSIDVLQELQEILRSNKMLLKTVAWNLSVHLQTGALFLVLSVKMHVRDARCCFFFLTLVCLQYFPVSTGAGFGNLDFFFC